MVHALEMEVEEEDNDEEERQSLTREVGGASSYRKQADGPSPPSSPKRNGRCFATAVAMTIAILFLLWITPKKEDADGNNSTTKPNHHDDATTKTASVVVQTNEEQPAMEPVAAVPAETTGPKLYSLVSQVVPDPYHVPLDTATQAALVQQWGKWKFWDGDEVQRPDFDYCGKYAHRDIPGNAFPATAWQADAVFVNHYLNDADALIARAMEAIFTEYGHGKPLPPEGLADRVKMFHWDKIANLNDADAQVPPKYAKRGDRGNGGWTTSRSFDGLVKRLLHACMTNDSFTVVLGGHSAAAGHGNHFHQSYLMQFHKIMAPIFARLGVKLVTRNLAQGGLGTLHNALGMGSLYGKEIDLLLWDSGMTEPNPELVDLFLRQGLLSGNRVPVLWGGLFDALKTLHNAADADVGEFGSGLDGIPEVASEEQAKSIAYAARFLKCDHERQDLCTNEPRFSTTCWIDRPDVPDPQTTFPKLAAKPSGQVKWHPGWRQHQLGGRVLAYSVLVALQAAVQIWSEGTMGGPPLDDSWWHVKDYYANIREKTENLDSSVGSCHLIAPNIPARICNTPLQARSMYTPRANPHETSITSILKEAPNSYKPRNEETVMFTGPDVHNPSLDIPPGEVDVLAIVSGRRRLSSMSYPLSDAVILQKLDVNATSNMSPSIKTKGSIHVNRKLANDIVPGLGWQVVDEFPGQCDGEYDSLCGRGKNDYCPLLHHHDSRGAIVGNEYAGWIVMELPNVKEGIIILKLVTYYPPEMNTRTEGWTSVSNEGREVVVEPAPPARRTLRAADSYPDTFQFDFSIDGRITTLSKEEFAEKLKEPQRVVELLTLLDDPNFTKTPKNVEVAFRMRGCGRTCTIALSHVYWA